MDAFNEKSITKNTITRASSYLRVIKNLRSLGFVRVYSSNLADALGLTPAVVRKDFSALGLEGKKKGGYLIDDLIARLEDLLGAQKPRKTVVVGCGRIGRALIESQELRREGIQIVAGFDVAPPPPDEQGEVPIYHVDMLQSFVQKEGIKVGILAVPSHAALEMFQRMRLAGMRGFLNFTTVNLKCQEQCPHGCEEQCIIIQINIALKLENLFHMVHITEHHPELLRE
ncbi:Redox-sensing transcriptional repressor rex [Spirochaeta thermophila DSM 6578]|uniref:Redox-sensing transcriptional repressor Rex n=1 Tax=Winmispira thermophila (strain ATCC 700085 / DSM 6578 / Z-1203) TaxID=869211 RepID=G0GAF6_WINT7|nr:redox-sensing transcriptional repressor Rex [Spirochaeta thermophila]AEJ61775.1 Redox-sensing transcriptional repressor rex [Spirochaeta thermophila DSM 6578]